MLHFLKLAEWKPLPYREVWLWIDFDERQVATGEIHGPDNDAGIWHAADFFTVWPGRLEKYGWTWLTPIITRLATDEDPATIRSDAVVEYAANHDGAPPATIDWDVAPSTPTSD